MLQAPGVVVAFLSLLTKTFVFLIFITCPKKFQNVSIFQLENRKLKGSLINPLMMQVAYVDGD